MNKIDRTTSVELPVEAWAPDSEGVWRNGGLAISLEADDPTRWRLDDTAAGEAILDGAVACYDRPPYVRLLEVIYQDLAEYDSSISLDGLESWCEQAEQLAGFRFDQLDEERERAAAEFQAELPGRLASDLLIEQPEEVDYLVPGLLVPGWTTKLAAREKVGKGTFAYYVIGCLEKNEATVLGDAFGRRVTTLVMSEEPPESTREKVELFGVEDSRLIWGYEMGNLDWSDKVALLIEAAIFEDHGLIFVDNISRAARIEDENGTEMGRAIELLQDAARAQNIAVLIDHHHKKGAGAVEDKSRGGTATAGAADINVDMVRKGGRSSRERQLTSRGRLRATFWERVVELSDDWNAYEDVTEQSNLADQGEDPMEAKLMYARMALGGVDSATAPEFAAKLGVSENTARERLRKLVADGDAEVEDEQPGRNKVKVYRLISKDEDEG